MLSMMQATLTLPGIAAIALVLGMAIDANVLINERVREELRAGASAADGHLGTRATRRAWGTILDSNVTTLIAGVALLAFGSGPVRGFAVVHCLGILTSMFSAVLFSRGLVNLWYGRKKKLQVGLDRPGLEAGRAAGPRPTAAPAVTRTQGLKGDHLMEFFRIRRDIPFMRHALVFNIISFVTFALAVFFLLTRGLHLSIEFTGGTVIEVEYAQSADIEQGPHHRRGDELRRSAGAELRHLARCADPPAAARGTSSRTRWSAACSTDSCARPRAARSSRCRSPPTRARASAARSARPAAGSITEPLKLTRSEFVGPQVGKELAEDGLKALAFVVVGIMIYLAIRFEWKFAVAAIIANLHDVIIILGFFAFFQWEFSLAVLAAVLAVLGYSVNESVVIFDRIREAFRKFRKLTTPEVIDHAITTTISRTIITHGSTQMMVLSMLLFGGPTLHYFAVALTIGICFGIYSSVFVAAAIAMWLGIKREDLVSAGAKKDQDPNDPNAGAVV